jgi:F-type H+-transporting ATPase subunit a
VSERGKTKKPPFLLIGIAIVVLALLVISFLGGPIGSNLLDVFGIHFQLPSWASVGQPQPELPAETLFYVYKIPVTNSMISVWLTTVFLLLISFFATRKAKMIPRGLQNVFEYVLGWLLSFCQGVAGEKNGRRFFPIVATIFLFVIVNAWMGLLPIFNSITVNDVHGNTVPLFRAANTDINVPLALAIFAFVAIEYYGIKSLHLSYLKKFVNISQVMSGLGQLFRGKIKSAFSSLFFGVINMFVGALEALSELVRLVSLTFRLFGNMTAGEILIMIAGFLVPWVLLSVLVYPLELLIGFIQALVFAGLTLIFMNMAVQTHEEE